jgi:hypothetical protein
MIERKLRGGPGQELAGFFAVLQTEGGHCRDKGPLLATQSTQGECGAAIQARHRSATGLYL